MQLQERGRICTLYSGGGASLCWRNAASPYGDFDLPWSNQRVHCWNGPKLEHSCHLVHRCYRERKSSHLAPPSFSFCFRFAFCFCGDAACPWLRKAMTTTKKEETLLVLKRYWNDLGYGLIEPCTRYRRKRESCGNGACCESQSSFQSWLAWWQRWIGGREDSFGGNVFHSYRMWTVATIVGSLVEGSVALIWCVGAAKPNSEGNGRTAVLSRSLWDNGFVFLCIYTVGRDGKKAETEHGGVGFKRDCSRGRNAANRPHE